MPWDHESVEEAGFQYIDAFHTDNPEDRYRVYKFHQDQPLIEFYPKKSDGFPLAVIYLEGFSFLPNEFAHAGYIKGGGTGYYLSSKLTEKNVIALTISKSQKDLIRKVRNKDAYRMVLSYSSFKRIKKSLTSISYVARQDRRIAVDEHFSNIFPTQYKRKALSARSRATRLINNIDANVIKFLKPNDVNKLLDFIEAILETKYKSVAHRQKLFGAAKIKVDEVALSDVIATFEIMLEDKLGEAKWGEFLKKNLFLVESKYIKLIPELNVVLAGSRKVDFGLVDAQGYLDLFEIKKPNTKILAASRDRGNYYWSTDATKALVQAEKYLYNSERKAPSLTEDINRELGVKVKVVRPRAVVILGHSSQFNSDEKKEDFRILRMSLKNVEVVLYDELLERLKNQRGKIYFDTSIEEGN